MFGKRICPIIISPKFLQGILAQLFSAQMLSSCFLIIRTCDRNNLHIIVRCPMWKILHSKIIWPPAHWRQRRQVQLREPAGEWPGWLETFDFSCRYLDLLPCCRSWIAWFLRCLIDINIGKAWREHNNQSKWESNTIIGVGRMLSRETHFWLGLVGAPGGSGPERTRGEDFQKLSNCFRSFKKFKKEWVTFPWVLILLFNKAQ